MTGAAEQIRAQVAELPTGRVAFSAIEARMSTSTLDRLDAWMPLEDLAYQLASDYAQAHRELPRTSRAITIVLVRDDTVPQNRVRARGSFRTPTDPQAVALARCTLHGPLAPGQADKAQHTVLRIEEPEPLDSWLAPGHDGSTRLDPDRTVAVAAAARDRAPRPRSREAAPASAPAGGSTLIGEAVPDARTVVADPGVDAPTVRVAPSADAPTVLAELVTAATAPVRVRPVRADLRLFRLDPMTGAATGEPPVLVSGDRASVGRADGSDVWLAERHVSRTHAEFRRMGSGWTIADAGSTWGTFVNEQPVASGQPHPLSAGDVVEFGRPSDRAVATRFVVG
jgi:hypothetical protein